MARRKRDGDRYGIHFTLRGEVKDEQAVWQHIAPLLSSGEASAWLREAVVEKLKNERATRPATPKSAPVRINGSVAEARYEEIEE